MITPWSNPFLPLLVGTDAPALRAVFLAYTQKINEMEFELDVLKQKSNSNQGGYNG